MTLQQKSIESLFSPQPIDFIKTEQNITVPEEPVLSASNDESHEPKEPKGHGRLPHTAYINANEHTIPLESLSAGHPCPLDCGGTLYSINPGILINIKGENLALLINTGLRSYDALYVMKSFQPIFQLMPTKKNIIQVLKQSWPYKNTTWPCRFIGKNIFNHSLVFPFRHLPNGN